MQNSNLWFYLYFPWKREAKRNLSGYCWTFCKPSCIYLELLGQQHTKKAKIKAL